MSKKDKITSLVLCITITIISIFIFNYCMNKIRNINDWYDYSTIDSEKCTFIALNSISEHIYATVKHSDGSTSKILLTEDNTYSTGDEINIYINTYNHKEYLTEIELMRDSADYKCYLVIILLLPIGIIMLWLLRYALVCQQLK